MASLPQSYDTWKTADPTAGKVLLGTCPTCGTDHFGSRGEEIQYEACAVCGIPLCSACEQHECSECGRLLCADHALRLGLSYVCRGGCRDEEGTEGETLDSRT